MRCDSRPPAAAGLESESGERVTISVKSIGAGRKSAEEEFTQAELAPVLSSPDAGTGTKINRIVQKLAAEG